MHILVQLHSTTSTVPFPTITHTSNGVSYNLPTLLTSSTLLESQYRHFKAMTMFRLFSPLRDPHRVTTLYAGFFYTLFSSLVFFSFFRMAEEMKKITKLGRRKEEEKTKDFPSFCISTFLPPPFS